MAKAFNWNRSAQSIFDVSAKFMKSVAKMNQLPEYAKLVGVRKRDGEGSHPS
jgi:hypothetical protein